MKKICLVFLMSIISILFLSLNKLNAYEIVGPEDGVDLSNICYGSVCLNTTPDLISEMNWIAPINTFDFSIADYPYLSNAYYNGQYIYIPNGEIISKDECNISNRELFLGEYVGPQNTTSSTFYNQGITGDFYIYDYYYFSSWLNQNHIVYDIFENCQKYEVINEEWSNDINLSSIVLKTSYSTGSSLNPTVYTLSYYYFKYNQIKDYLEEAIDYLEENTEQGRDELVAMSISAFISLISSLMLSQVIGSFISGFTAILGIMNEINSYEQVQTIDFVEDMVSALEANSDRILRLKYKWILYPGILTPIAYRSYDVMDSMDIFTFPIVNITNENEKMTLIKYYDYSFDNVQNLFEDFSETSLMVIDFIEE